MRQRGARRVVGRSGPAIEAVAGAGVDVHLRRHAGRGLAHTIDRYGRDVLGKGVVLCKDTPTFIANRFISIVGSYTIAYAMEHGYTVEEVDNLTGPLIGRPKTATFRLNDLVGNDVLAHVSENLYDTIPDDPEREILRDPKLVAVVKKLLDEGWLLAPGTLFQVGRRPSTCMRVNFAATQDGRFWRRLASGTPQPA